MDQPAYQRIAADIRRRIHSGEWQPGRLLPSWRWLADQYGVSQGAVRVAIRQLRDEWLVEGTQRAQLWVAYPPAVRTLTDADAEWPYARGDGESGSCNAGENLAGRLDVPYGTILHWERRELLDPGARPAILITTWQQPVANIHEHETARCEIRPHVLTGVEAALFGLAVGMPALLVERTRYGADGKPVQIADLVLPADRWRIGWASSAT